MQINKTKKIILNLLFIFTYLVSTINAKEIVTLYGSFDIKENEQEAVLLEIIEHPAMQRLKNIHQYGVSHYVKKDILYAGDRNGDYTRYEHSLGVFALLRLYERPLTEQIAGLIHDISHTAFSHVADHLFKMTENKSYQDVILPDFLKEQGLNAIIAKYGFKIRDILPDNKKQYALERELPDICADRLEYTLQGGLKAGILSLMDIQNILANLRFNETLRVWYFVDICWANKLAQASLYLTQNNSGAAWNAIIYDLAAQALKRAIEIKLFSLEKLTKEMVDEEVWKLLEKKQDTQIKNLIFCVKNHKFLYSIIDQEESSENESIIYPKFRLIDPLISLNEDESNFERLSKLDTDFGEDYCSLKTKFNSGLSIRYTLSTERKIIKGC